MEDFGFPMGLDQSGIVPEVFHVPVGGDLGGHHDFYDEFLYTRAGDTCSAVCAKPASGSFMCDAGEVGEESIWFDEPKVLSNFILDEALSVSPDSSCNSAESSPFPILKSPMEIFREIEEEASRFVPSSPAETKEYTYLTTVEAREPSQSPCPSTSATSEPFVSFVAENGSLFSGVPLSQTNAEVRHLTSFEINSIVGTQSSFLQQQQEDTMDAIEMSSFSILPNQTIPVVPVIPQSVQVAELVGSELVLQDGTRLVIVGSGTDQQTEADTETSMSLPDESSPASADAVCDSPAGSEKHKPLPAKKGKRTYQKGGYERKKMQNRESAQRYRVKIKAQKEQIANQRAELLDRNKDLKSHVEDLQREINYWRKMMEDMQARR